MIDNYVRNMSKIFRYFLVWNEINQHYINGYLQLVQLWWIKKRRYKRVLLKVYLLLKNNDTVFKGFLKDNFKKNNMSALILEDVLIE